VDQILEEIRKALKKKSLSESAASRLAGGNPSIIKNLRTHRGGSGRAHPIENLQKVAAVLDLEFYVGPPREVQPAPELELDDGSFVTVPRYEAEAAAGDGCLNVEGAPSDRLAFSRRWLDQNGILASACILINARGDSMEPSIYDGDLVMIDRRRREIRSGRIYVYNDPDDGTRIKRLELVPGNLAIIVRSDNPDQARNPPLYITGDAMNALSASILGEVVWSGHRWS